MAYPKPCLMHDESSFFDSKGNFEEQPNKDKCAFDAGIAINERFFFTQLASVAIKRYIWLIVRIVIGRIPGCGACVTRVFVRPVADRMLMHVFPLMCEIRPLENFVDGISACRLFKSIFEQLLTFARDVDT